ncbi:ubiquitin-conjugating enzyme/RWD-like protein [Protomyces lactucae-debilis]|uniref:E2 ubiquitin-conjugating enzyme n=1 Tax=Protomyces lactucae-debilis TaxID=2754530 RepID=A0A1Y2FBG0_PROLT|nr:ubiquitin-conjugating enzyme/RWD-like protein [Protomyces lactucae-debilis]ORY80957.1 ubiquitin-conjugating enzyme/RWD-like protein [Protomyces lactucae-debilis]
MTAVRRLMKEYQDLTTNPPDGITAGPISEDNFYLWEALLAGPDDSPFEGGLFPAILKFPKDYPLSPPTMTFQCALFHPNIYPSGDVCISILHAPGDDQFGYEKASERWSPVQSVEKVLLSVMSMLAEPNDESPANIDAAKMWRDDNKQYVRVVRKNVRDVLGL